MIDTESKQNDDERPKLAVGEIFHVIGTSSNDDRDGINGRDCSLPASAAPANITDLDVDMVYGLSIYTHTHSTALCLGLPGRAGTRKVKPIWILLKQETVSGSGISWAICKSAPCSRWITTPPPHHSVVYRPDALPSARPTASEH